MTFDEAYTQFRPWIIHQARIFCGMSEDANDCIQVGLVGLWIALRTHKPERGAKFFSFARIVIEREMRRWLFTYGQLVRMPRPRHRKGERVPVLSMETEITDARKGRALTLAETLKAPEPEEDVTERTRIVTELVETLAARDREVLRRTIVGEESDEQVGESLGCTGDNVRLIRGKAINRIRRALKMPPTKTFSRRAHGFSPTPRKAA